MNTYRLSLLLAGLGACGSALVLTGWPDVAGPSPTRMLGPMRVANVVPPPSVATSGSEERDQYAAVDQSCAPLAGRGPVVAGSEADDDHVTASANVVGVIRTLRSGQGRTDAGAQPGRAASLTHVTSQPGAKVSPPAQVPATIDDPAPGVAEQVAPSRAAHVDPVSADANGSAKSQVLQALMIRRNLRFRGGRVEADFKPVAPRSPG